MKRLVTALVVVALAAGCYYGDTGAATADEGAPWSLVGFSRSGADTLHVSGDASRATITAPATNAEANTRIGWLVDDGDYATNLVCATWASHSGAIDQPGLVVHFDGTRGYTVTQNIYGGRQTINVHYWDLSEPEATRYHLLLSFQPSGIGDGTGWPLRACARAAGPFLDAKVWPANRTEPAWGDAAYGAGLLIGAPRAGRGGWYGGHLGAGGRMMMTDLTEEHS